MGSARSGDNAPSRDKTIQRRGGRSLGVLVGVTSHQGAQESCVQGEGAESGGVRITNALDVYQGEVSEMPRNMIPRSILLAVAV